MCDNARTRGLVQTGCYNRRLHARRRGLPIEPTLTMESCGVFSRVARVAHNVAGCSKGSRGLSGQGAPVKTESHLAVVILVGQVDVTVDSVKDLGRLVDSVAIPPRNLPQVTSFDECVYRRVGGRWCHIQHRTYLLGSDDWHREQSLCQANHRVRSPLVEQIVSHPVLEFEKPHRPLLGVAGLQSHSFEKEPDSRYDVTCLTGEEEMIVVVAPAALEEGGQIQQRLRQSCPLNEYQWDHQPADTAVAVQERMSTTEQRQSFSRHKSRSQHDPPRSGRRNRLAEQPATESGPSRTSGLVCFYDIVIL